MQAKLFMEIIKKIDSNFSDEEMFLIELLFRDVPELFDLKQIDEQKLIKIAIKNGLSQLLHKNAFSGRLSEEMRRDLKKEYLYNLGKNSAFQMIAEEISKKLIENKIQVIYLKGICLINNVYQDIALRPMSDIDILVHQHDIHKAWKLFNSKDFDIKRNDEKTAHHLPIFSYKGINVELHRFLFPTDVKYQIPIDEIWRQATETINVNTLILNPIHLIIYQLLHIYYTYRQGGLRLGWFYDIKEIIKHFDKDISLENVAISAQRI